MNIFFDSDSEKKKNKYDSEYFILIENWIF